MLSITLSSSQTAPQRTPMQSSRRAEPSPICTWQCCRQQSSQNACPHPIRVHSARGTAQKQQPHSTSALSPVGRPRIPHKHRQASELHGRRHACMHACGVALRRCLLSGIPHPTACQVMSSGWLWMHGGALVQPERRPGRRATGQARLRSRAALWSGR